MIGIVFGELTAPYQSERVQAIEDLFADTGLHYRATEYIKEEMWCKFRLNVGNNLPQAVLGAGVGCYRDSTHMKEISNKLREELEAIAAAKGIDIRKADDSSSHGSAFRHPQDILPFRIWMQDVTQKSICSHVR